jgi:hypothetical protein
VILLGGSDSGAAIVNLVDLDFLGKPRRRALCDHFAMIEDPRVAGGASVARNTAACRPREDRRLRWRRGIAAWDKARPPFPRRYLLPAPAG